MPKSIGYGAANPKRKKGKSIWEKVQNKF